MEKKFQILEQQEFRKCLMLLDKKLYFFIQFISVNADVSMWETPCMGAYHFCWFWEKILYFLEN